jgi:hypothetical protein
MSYICASGYGYSKKLCEDVTSWFLNKYFPRHKITLDIVHRGLNREKVYGYCDVVGEYHRPRHFLIEMNTHMDKELYVKTLLHELTHMKQWVDGVLRSRYGKLCYSKEPVEKYEYWYQPHEVEARYMEEELYHEYLFDRNLITVEEVCNSFPNRLMNVL